MAYKAGRSNLGFGGLLAGAVFGAAGAWYLYSRFSINHNLPLPEAIPAGRESLVSPRLGQISYYASREGQGKPLVLVHSINAAASAYEMQTLFEAYRTRRPVYALDWPGYGFSDRSRRIYSPQLYQDVLIEFLTTVVREPADVVALSLGGEFSARAALQRPELFHSLAILSPTGLSRLVLSTRAQHARPLGMSNALHPFLAFRLWGLPLFDLIATRSSIEFFLRKSFVSHIPPGMVEYAYATAHQPGAENAALYFLAGKLFTPQVRERIYESLRVPTLALYDSDPYSTYEALPDLLLKNHHWQAVRLVPSQGMAQWERLADTREVLDAFWKSVK
jgi:pimeloyl-ACP methyl ester carboxylesterase